MSSFQTMPSGHTHSVPFQIRPPVHTGMLPDDELDDEPLDDGPLDDEPLDEEPLDELEPQLQQQQPA
jgi:hypothetical protein